MNRIWPKLICSLILISWTSISKAQNAEQLLESAIQAFKVQNYQSTTENLERVLFFKSEIINSKHFLIWAQASLFRGDTLAVEPLLRQAINKSETESEKIDLTLKLAQFLMNLQDFEQAKALLLSINALEPNSTNLYLFKQKLLALCYFAGSEFETSRQILKEAYPEKLLAIDSLFESVNYIQKRYKPKRAKLMNMIIPGLGFWYAGDFWKGVNSFLLTTGILTLGGVYAKSTTIFDSLLSIFSPLQRYYMGGYQRATLATISKRKLYENQIVNHLFGL